ncbi:hypothetical protein J34TS1_48600 [Paenibacillus azoreducens]|uniref:Uncharacterized protein n=1 Tax=Paenibacillus azoreducens TaxID=116718 RepID=A0A920CT86_9BACL|nr:hypothetical protein J34TS1_48600 [Paenibacillus azoreducens]
MPELFFRQIADPGQLYPLPLKGGEEEEDPHDKRQDGNESCNKRPDQGNEAAQHMGDHDGSESEHGLQRVKQNEAAAFLQS